MLTGKTQDFYIKMQIPADTKSNDLVIPAKVFGQGEPGQVYDDQTRLVFQYAGQAEVETDPENTEFMERYSIVELAETATEALKLERKGQRDEAHQILNESINRNSPYISAKEADNY